MVRDATLLFLSLFPLPSRYSFLSLKQFGLNCAYNLRIVQCVADVFAMYRLVLVSPFSRESYTFRFAQSSDDILALIAPCTVLKGDWLFPPESFVLLDLMMIKSS